MKEHRNHLKVKLSWFQICILIIPDLSTFICVVLTTVLLFAEMFWLAHIVAIDVCKASDQVWHAALLNNFHTKLFFHRGEFRTKKISEIKEELDIKYIIRHIKTLRLKWARNIMERKPAEIIERIDSEMTKKQKST